MQQKYVTKPNQAVKLKVWKPAWCHSTHDANLKLPSPFLGGNNIPFYYLVDIRTSLSGLLCPYITKCHQENDLKIKWRFGIRCSRSMLPQIPAVSAIKLISEVQSSEFLTPFLVASTAFFSAIFL